MTKSEINKFYNIDKIISAKELAQLSKSYKDNLETIIVMMNRKQSKPDVLQQILDKLTSIDTRLTKVEENQSKDHNLLLKVIKLNNLKTK